MRSIIAYYPKSARTYRSVGVSHHPFFKKNIKAENFSSNTIVFIAAPARGDASQPSHQPSYQFPTKNRRESTVR